MWNPVGLRLRRSNPLIENFETSSSYHDKKIDYEYDEDDDKQRITFI